jgi:hypothetical protein
MEEESSVTELWPACQFCKQDRERKLSEGRGDLYLVIRSDEAELLKRPTRRSGQSVKITVAKLAHKVALSASLM